MYYDRFRARQAGSSFCENRPDAQLVGLELHGAEPPAFVDSAVSVTPLIVYPDAAPPAEPAPQASAASVHDASGDGRCASEDEAGPASPREERAAPHGNAGKDAKALRGAGQRGGAAAVSYLVRFPDVPGRFDVARATAAGVPAGPMFGRLKSGQAVTLPCGRVVSPDECVHGGAEGDVLAVIDCPSLAHLASLAVHPAWRRRPCPPRSAPPHPKKKGGGSSSSDVRREAAEAGHGEAAGDGEDATSGKGWGVTVAVHLAPQVR